MRCAKSRRDGLKSVRSCGEQLELDVRTLLWTRGKAFPISLLSSCMRCPKCGSREVTVRLTLPGSVLAAAVTRSTKRDRHDCAAHTQYLQSLFARPSKRFNGFLPESNVDGRSHFWARVHATALPPQGIKAKPGTEWLKPGLVGKVRHLKGEQQLRHATLREIKAGKA